MKKPSRTVIIVVIIIIVCILLAFFITSLLLNKAKNKTNNPYLFYEKNLTLMKVDANTGKATPVCADPLCKHSSPECPFYRPAGVGNRFTLTEDNDTMFFIAGAKDTYCLRRYSLTKGTIKDCFSTGNPIKDMLLVDNYLFFTEQIIGDTENSETIKTSIYRLDISDNKVKKLTTTPEENTVVPIFMVEDKLMWQIFELSKSYTTTLDYEDRQEITSIQKTYKGDYNYKLTFVESPKDPELSKINLTRISKTTNETKTILTGIRHFRVCDNFILYTRVLEKASLIGKIPNSESIDLNQQTTYYNYLDTKLYSCNLDGTNEKVICELEPGYYFFSASSAVGYTKYYGDYHLIDLYKYSINENGEITGISADEKMVVNVRTGEYNFVTE